MQIHPVMTINLLHPDTHAICLKSYPTIELVCSKPSTLKRVCQKLPHGVQFTLEIEVQNCTLTTNIIHNTLHFKCEIIQNYLVHLSLALCDGQHLPIPFWVLPWVPLTVQYVLSTFWGENLQTHSTALQIHTARIKYLCQFGKLNGFLYCTGDMSRRRLIIAYKIDNSLQPIRKQNTMSCKRKKHVKLH